MDKNLDADTKKVGKFLKGLTEVEFRYLQLTMPIVHGIKILFNKYNITKERFIELFGIKEKDYKNYISGNYIYTIRDMAKLDNVHQTLATENENN